jgi:hypothetical protein
LKKQKDNENKLGSDEERKKIVFTLGENLDISDIDKNGKDGLNY